MDTLARAQDLLRKERFAKAARLLAAIDGTPGSLLALGRAQHGMYHLQQARLTLSRARRASRDPVLRAHCDFELGVTHNKIGDVAAARKLFERAKCEYEHQGSESERLKCDLYLAITFARNGDFPAYLSRYKALAKSLQRKKLAELYAIGQCTQCACLVSMKHFGEARRVIRAGLAHARRHGLIYREALFTYYLASVTFDLKGPASVRPLLVKLKALRRACGAAILKADIATLEVRQAYASGDLNRAANQSQLAHAAYRECGYMDGAALCLVNSAFLGIMQGNIGAALSKLSEAVSITESTRNETLQAIAEMHTGWAHGSVGSAAIAQKFLSAAAQTFVRYKNWPFAMACCAQLARFDDTATQAWFERAAQYGRRCENSGEYAVAIAYLAEHHASRGETDDAKNHASTALAIFDQLRLGPERLRMRLVVAQCDLASGRVVPQIASRALDKAVAGMPVLGARLSMLRAQNARMTGDVKMALRQLKLAAVKARLIRVSSVDPVLAGYLAATLDRIFQDGCALAFELDKVELALDFSNLRRAQWLKQRQGSGASKARRALARSARPEELGSLSELSERTRLLHLATSHAASWANPMQKSEIRALQRTVARLEQRYMRYDASRMARAGADAPDVIAPPMSLEHLRANLRQRYGESWSAIALEPLDHSGDTWLRIRVTPTDCGMTRLMTGPVERLHLGMLCDPDGHARKLSYGASPVSEAMRHRIAAWLGCADWLLPNASPDQILLIASAGRLNDLAVSALPVLDNTPLSARARIVHVPALDLVRPVRRKTPRESARVLVVAPGEFGGRHPALPRSAAEVAAARTLWPHTHVLVGTDASVESLRALNASGALAKFDVILFATHACHVPDRPRLSAIACTDGDISADEISDWRLNADLVCISACESGRSQVHGGEERIGLEPSLLAAGTRHVLSALWPVGDAASARFVQTALRHYHAEGNGVAAVAAAHRQLQSVIPQHEHLAWRITTL